MHLHVWCVCVSWGLGSTVNSIITLIWKIFSKSPLRNNTCQTLSFPYDVLQRGSIRWDYRPSSLVLVLCPVLNNYSLISRQQSYCNNMLCTDLSQINWIFLKLVSWLWSLMVANLCTPELNSLPPRSRMARYALALSVGDYSTGRPIMKPDTGAGSRQRCDSGGG